MSRGFHRGQTCILRIALDEAAFRTLVSGGIAQVRGYTIDAPAEIEIILSDIGWEKMFEAIRAAKEKNRSDGHAEHSRA